MKDLARIEAVWMKLDAALEREFLSTNVGDRAKLVGQQVINDQAYFLLCWGQLEIEIDDVCRTAIRRRRTHADWQVRRSWYLYNPEDKRLSGLSFEERAALVLDRDEKGNGSAWKKVMTHYTARNEIAHGRLRSTRIDVSSFIQDCHVIQAALNRSP